MEDPSISIACCFCNWLCAETLRSWYLRGRSPSPHQKNNNKKISNIWQSNMEKPRRGFKPSMQGWQLLGVLSMEQHVGGDSKFRDGQTHPFKKKKKRTKKGKKKKKVGQLKQHGFFRSDSQNRRTSKRCSASQGCSGFGHVDFSRSRTALNTKISLFLRCWVDAT